MDRLKADLGEHGFGMLEGALEMKTTARIRERVLEQGAADRRIGLRTRDMMKQVSSPLHDAECA